jgi:hypothetical protein
MGGEVAQGLFLGRHFLFIVLCLDFPGCEVQLKADLRISP